MFNFNHLYYFYIVAKSQNTSIAASHLHISQPSLSTQLKVLEDMLQIKLFRKVGRTNKLTEQGQSIFSYCQKIFCVAEELHETLVNNFSSAARKVYIGVAKEIHQNFIVDSIDHFNSLYAPNDRPQIVLTTMSHEQLIERLSLREFDLGLTEQKVSHGDLTSLLEIASPVSLVSHFAISKTIAGTKKKPIKNQIKEGLLQWALPNLGFKLRHETDRFFELNQIEGKVNVECDDMGALLRVISLGMGHSFLPQIYFQKELEEKTVKSYGPKGGYWVHRLWINGHVQSKADEQIAALIKSFAFVSKKHLAV